MKDYVGVLDRRGLSWCLWTYKTVARSSPMGFWGLYSNPTPAVAIDPFSDSEAEMLRKIELVRTEHLRSPDGLLEAFRS